MPEDYGFVLLGLIGVAFHCTWQGMKIFRSKAFGQEYVDKHLQEENKAFNKKYGYDIPKGVYPDMGDGRHGSKLEYETWLQYSCNQRAHQNYVEGLTQVLFIGGVAGLSCPRVTTALLVAYMAAREVFCRGYRANGPTGRINGARLQAIALIAMLLVACNTVYQSTPYAKVA